MNENKIYGYFFWIFYTFIFGHITLRTCVHWKKERSLQVWICEHFELVLNLNSTKKNVGQKTVSLNYFQRPNHTKKKKNVCYLKIYTWTGSTSCLYRCNFISHSFYFFLYLINCVISDKCNLRFDHLFFDWNFFLNTMNFYRFYHHFVKDACSVELIHIKPMFDKNNIKCIYIYRKRKIKVFKSKLKLNWIFYSLIYI